MAEDHALNESELDEALAKLPGWELRDSWLRRTFTTPGWPHTMMLVTTIGSVTSLRLRGTTLI